MSERGMAYGGGPWTDETRALCQCGHPRGDHFRHFRHSAMCLHSTDSETWACMCDAFRPAHRTNPAEEST